MNPTQELARYLLINRMSLPEDQWTVQGFGFLRLRISDSMRLHVWDSRLRTPEVSDIHDHEQWAFRSFVISGSIINIRYLPSNERGSVPYHKAIIQAGMLGGMTSESPTDIRLIDGEPEHYVTGQFYDQAPLEIHRTFASDGTVTLLSQRRTDVDTATVFWPHGSKWGDAKPRQARTSEIDAVGRYALSVWQDMEERDDG